MSELIWPITILIMFIILIWFLNKKANFSGNLEKNLDQIYKVKRDMQSDIINLSGEILELKDKLKKLERE